MKEDNSMSKLMGCYPKASKQWTTVHLMEGMQFTWWTTRRKIIQPAGYVKPGCKIQNFFKKRFPTYYVSQFINVHVHFAL